MSSRPFAPHSERTRRARGETFAGSQAPAREPADPGDHLRPSVLAAGLVPVDRRLERMPLFPQRACQIVNKIGVG
jgi:hypothetical protein